MDLFGPGTAAKAHEEEATMRGKCFRSVQETVWRSMKDGSEKAATSAKHRSRRRRKEEQRLRHTNVHTMQFAMRLLLEEAYERRWMALVLRPAAAEEGALGDEPLPPLASRGAPEQGGDVVGHEQQYLEDDVVREKAGRRLFHLGSVYTYPTETGVACEG